MKITLFTTTTFSDVQEYQSKTIKKYMGQWDHYLIDGRNNWFNVWYKWLDIARDLDSDYFIHIDEDCFILDNKEIYKTIDKMIENNYDISGSPDGYTHYRGGNYMAMNSFFMIVSKKAVISWFNRINVPQFKKEWLEEYPFTKINSSHIEYNQEFGSSGKSVETIWKPYTEPYYDFFWVLKENGIKFNYLEPILGEDFYTTDLLNNTIKHLWHQRQRDCDYVVSELHKEMSNKKRYDKFLKYLEKYV